jgi:hypothetical protein
MRKQIVHISVHQTSKVIAAMHAAMISVLFILPTVLGHLFHGKIVPALLILLLVPFFIWLFMYIGYVIACWFYNLVAPWTGGIEIEVKDIGLQPEPIVTKSEIIEAAPEQKEGPSETNGPIEKL